jgi:2-polyprenyl-6-methoxyphenol hydroxylase-like FAD-dependent oxidoreductase
MTATSGFKVIVVGGGPVGLVAAHALTRAGIDFLVLEGRHGIVIDAGSNLVLLPTGMRVLGQLGLLGALTKVSSPLGKAKRIDHEGNDIGDFNVFVHMGEK